jgi:hypothetical protein
MSKDLKTDLEGWNRNTALGCNLKTLLCSDRVMKTGKEYLGVLRRDVECEEFRYDEHYTFIEMLPWLEKRNPKLFSGKYISITRRPDGSLRPNFRPVLIDENFSVVRYALGVSNELMQALEGLVEKLNTKK